MTLLCPFQLDGFYARPARRIGCVVLFLPNKVNSATYDPTFPTWLRQNGARLVETMGDRTGYRCLLISAPAWLRAALLQAAPEPPSRGTYTLGNFLPF